MAKDTQELGLRVDYTQICAELYTSVTAVILGSGGSRLHILSWCRSPARMDGLPSWVPDWSQTHPRSLMLGDGAYLNRYEAGGCRAQRIRLTVQGPMLMLDGVVAGIVKKLGPSGILLKDRPKPICADFSTLWRHLRT
ncbi:hypothetical protein QBC38DRAFT_80238 [Podospora fimiseda]|uniref:Uncharacterized protein n=1 Tax=Podospora fimiseda TaxID=252190 RepID=A0AAN6YRF4_9PEZI|nr:hypothetical protein QBC38DRAFT_80238 [Podospora fimiseda]